MKKMEMFEKMKELFKTVDELFDYGFYTHLEMKELKDKAFENFNRIWG